MNELLTVFYLSRNNLTIVETVVIQGQGGCGELRFGNRKASSVSPLLFDMTEKHLKYCDSKYHVLLFQSPSIDKLYWADPAH